MANPLKKKTVELALVPKPTRIPRSKERAATPVARPVELIFLRNGEEYLLSRGKHPELALARAVARLPLVGKRGDVVVGWDINRGRPWFEAHWSGPHEISIHWFFPAKG